MSFDSVPLRDGRRWFYKDFVEHWRNGTGQPVSIDAAWYMDKGPGRYFHPGMFPVVQRALQTRLPAGTYNLANFARFDKELKAHVSHYKLEPTSGFGVDWFSRMSIFGNEWAKISGTVVVGPDGRKSFYGVEITPEASDFDFEPSSKPPPFEQAAKAAEFLGNPFGAFGSPRKFALNYAGSGKIYRPFDEQELKRALSVQDEYGRPHYDPIKATQPREVTISSFADPPSAWPGLKEPPVLSAPAARDEHLFENPQFRPLDRARQLDRAGPSGQPGPLDRPRQLDAPRRPEIRGQYRPPYVLADLPFHDYPHPPTPPDLPPSSEELAWARAVLAEPPPTVPDSPSLPGPDEEEDEHRSRRLRTIAGGYGSEEE